MSKTMRAVVLEAPGPPEALVVRDRPVPAPRPNWALIRVEAFGLNRSELHTRLGLAGASVSFPRVPGIEATGIVEAAPGHPELEGKKAVTMMGGMGREFDGGYAEYTLVPVSQVITVETDLDWARLGAPIAFVPTGVRLTAYGGEAHDLPAAVLDETTALMAAGEFALPIHTYRLDDIATAHADMEHNRVVGKQVVLTR